MSNCWWLILTSCIGGASLQYISSGDSQIDSDPIPTQSNLPPLPYANFFNLPSVDGYNLPNTEEHSQFYTREDQEQVERKRRDIEVSPKERWLPDLVDNDDQVKNDKTNPVIIKGYGNFGSSVNSTDYDLLEAIEKRNFSPWGGKRSLGQGWGWKRNAHEQNMPKRVRFSPWGGKRSGQILYNPGNTGMKSSKMIFSTTLPELTNVITNYAPERLDSAGLHFVPNLGKRHPIEILALKFGTGKDALPFKQYLESLPKSFKLGHTYSEVNLKKDGKRKMKFSAWGGKRSPPIIGPIWTPQELKAESLDAYVLMHDGRKQQMASPF